MLVEDHRRVEGLGELDVLADARVKACVCAISSRRRVDIERAGRRFDLRAGISV